MQLPAWLRDLVFGGPPLFRAASPRELRLNFIYDYGVALVPPTNMLVHGPGATDALTAPNAAGDGNSAVFACLAALAAAYIEAPLRVYETKPGAARQQVTRGAPLGLQQLLDRPNPSMTGQEVWHWVQWAKHIDGNAYLQKIRAGDGTRGNVVELWPRSPTRMEIRSEGGQFITAYRWHYGPGRYEDLPPENVLHFKLGLDDADPRRGLAPLKRLVRSLSTDAAAEQWSAALLQNGALPGLVVQTPGALTQEQADLLKAKLRALYGGDRRGDVGVLDAGATLQQLGWNPEQMAFAALSRQPESRISGVLRVPAIVAGLGVGLDQATYSNARTLTEFFTERTMIPLWTMDAAKLQQQLVPDFTRDPNVSVAFDLSGVRALAEDQDARSARLDKAVAGGWLTINEAREDSGLDPLPGGDVRRVPVNVLEVPTGQAAPVMPAPGATVAARGPLEQGALDLHGDAGSDADRAAWRARAWALEDAAPLLGELLLAQPNGNGHG